MIIKKIKGAECAEGIIEDNGVLAFTKYVIMVVKGDRGEPFIVERPEKFGGNVKYMNYESLEKDFAAKKLHPLDLKTALAKEINNFLKPIRDKHKQLEKIAASAYSS